MLIIIHYRMSEYNINADISSAEMTAYYRSVFENISKDNISSLLVSKEGIAKAKAFDAKYNYELVYRKISLRAGFFYEEALDLLKTGCYDSCISFASGFSTLTYTIRKRLVELNDIYSSIKFIDSDLPHIIHERNSRFEELLSNNGIDELIYKKIKANVLDLEEAASKSLSLMDLYPNCKRPLFLIEGVVYFLSTNCLNWLIKEVSEYHKSAIIIDYWPENSLGISRCFSTIYKDLKNFIPEQTKSFWNNNLKKAF